MPVADIIAIVEFIKGLNNGRIKARKEIFEEQIQPVWNSFLNIHKNYKSSIQSYLDLISQEDTTLQKVREHVAEDSVFTEDMRSELGNLMYELEQSTVALNYSTELSSFIEKLRAYFGASEMDVKLPNAPRYNLITLTYTYEYDNSRNGNLDESTFFYVRRQFKNYLHSMLAELQNAYVACETAFFQMKSKILNG